MDQGLKERLVGAAVLVAIAVWLIPWVLDGPDDEVETSTSSLRLPAVEEPLPMRTQTLRLGGPPASSNEAAPPAESPAPAIAAAAAARSDAAPGEQQSPAAGPPPDSTVAANLPAPAPERETPAAQAPTTPKPSAAAATASAAGDWAVQLGSFSDEANARRQAQRAGTFGYKAEVSSHRSDGRTLYRVRVGPQPTRAAADAAASALRAHGMDARVVAAR
jgi:DedD protein